MMPYSLVHSTFFLDRCGSSMSLFVTIAVPLDYQFLTLEICTFMVIPNCVDGCSVGVSFFVSFVVVHYLFPIGGCQSLQISAV